MGLWKLLTTPLLTDAATLRWQQPLFLGMRLRGEVWRRIALLAGCIITGASALAISIALSRAERVPLAAVAIGGLFGLLVALYVAFRKEDWGGHVLVGPDGIQLRRTYPAFPVLLGVEHITWPCDSIRRCVIVPGKSMGTRYSVLLISSGDSTQLLGIAGWVDPRDLGRRLKGNGVDVALAEAIPGKLVTPKVKPAFVLGILGVGGLLALVALVVTPRWGGNANLAARDIDEVRQNLANPFPERVRDIAQFGAPEIMNNDHAGMVEGIASGPPDDRAPGRDGPLAGGSGGFPFRIVSESKQNLCGVTWFAGEWAGQRAIARLDPIFDRTTAIGDDQTVIAPEGYAVGAIDVVAGDFVFAVRLVFMRIQPDGRLDPADLRMSDWLGSPTGGAELRLSGEGAMAIGLHGRGGAVVDAIGLVFP